MLDKVKTPEEYGLPGKFDKFRPVQEDGLRLLANSTKRAKALCMPTGSGKSVVAVAHSLSCEVPTAIVTATRGLQSQYLSDFQEVGMVSLMGRSNYKCDLHPEDPTYTCEDGYAARCPYKGTVACDCSKAEMQAASSSLIVTNYAKWTASGKFGIGLQHIQQVIFDEGHYAAEALAQAVQVVLHHHEIEEKLGMDFPKRPEADSFSTWKSWAAYAKVEAEVAMHQAEDRIKGLSDPRPSWVKHFNHMKALWRRLSTLALANPNDWIVDEIEKGYQFDPIRPARYSEGTLLLRVPNIVVMSATQRPKSMYMIGLGKDQFDFKEFDSDFDPTRCPIYYIPTMRVDSRAVDLSMLWVRHDQIASKRQDRNGIVHTISYAKQGEIKTASRFSSKMLINPKGEPPSRMVEEFISRYPGAILVSPSVGTGYDFKYKAAEWQFICKIPFEPPSKIVKARDAADPEYRSYKAAQSLDQMAGRIMRDAKDQGETFIADDHVTWFIPKYAHLFSKNFHRLLKKAMVIPNPPKRLK